MTDRLKGCTVVFDCSIREDDADAILNAIRMVKGVASVTTSADSPDDWMNRERVKLELRQKLLAVVLPELKP